MRKNPLGRKLQTGDVTSGLWVTMECAAVTEIAVSLGIDWVVIDMEHGHLDFKDVMDHLRVVRGSDTAALVRVPAIEGAPIKRVLDMGAHGLILPLVRTRADVERAFRFGRYPPDGDRGVGGERAVQWGLTFREYLEVANDETLLIPLIETHEAVEEIDEILAVPGLEAIFFGPADLSASSGFLGEWEGPGVAEQILEIRQKAAERGIASGVMAVDVANSIDRRDQGFRMIGLGSEAGLVVRALRENLSALDKEKKPLSFF